MFMDIYGVRVGKRLRVSSKNVSSNVFPPPPPPPPNNNKQWEVGMLWNMKENKFLPVIANKHSDHQHLGLYCLFDDICNTFRLITVSVEKHFSQWDKCKT